MILIKNATIVNEGKSFVGSVLIDGEYISTIYKGNNIPEHILQQADKIIDAAGQWLLPGVIDDQVHFRDPGLTHKGDIYSESRAAVAGGVTSFMDMPNTNPQTTTIDALQRKYEVASENSVANYSFYLGATNDNIAELLRADKHSVCGIKVFMGASTGNMLVDNEYSLQRIFAEVDMLIATHCEKEEIIREHVAQFKAKFGDDVPVEFHPEIRDAEACYRSSSQAVELADKYGSKLHVLHLSTARELSLFDVKPLEDKKITAEVCVHHLWFSDADYTRLGERIKWNPSVKTVEDRDALRSALREYRLDVVATDHAPHLISEKQGGALKAASGGPLVQHALLAMLELARQGVFTVEQVVSKMSHAPATLFQIHKRGFIREGYYADLVLVNSSEKTEVTTDTIRYKCGWSPFEGEVFSHRIDKTLVNGHLVFDGCQIDDTKKGLPLSFDR